MNYQTFHPHPDLKAIVKCYWSLEVPVQHDVQRQLILPDGCMDMIFMLGDDVKRYTSEDDFLIQPRAMILGQITQPFYVEPMGMVHSFAVRFYPYGFSNFLKRSLHSLANTETPLHELFGEERSAVLTAAIIKAETTAERITVIERFLFELMAAKTTIDAVVKNTIDTILSTGGRVSINSILKDNLSKRRQLERKFLAHIGISPKQLGRVVRLQGALALMLNTEHGSLTHVAYENDYYDQAHFIKDFKEFTGTTPKAFLDDEKMKLSSLFYRNE